MKLALPTDADMVTDHVGGHVIRLHRSCNGRGSLLLNDAPLLDLYLLIDLRLTWFSLIIVVLYINGLASIASKHDIVCVLLNQTLHHALLVINSCVRFTLC